MLESIAASFYLTLLLVLSVYVFGVLGLTLFSKAFDNVDPNVNYVTDAQFNNLWQASLSAFQVMTGDNWTANMYSTSSAMGRFHVGGDASELASSPARLFSSCCT